MRLPQMPPPRLALLAVLLAALALAGCASQTQNSASVPAYAGRTPEMDALIARAAHAYDVPVSLVHRVVERESGYDAGARHGPYWGLMQIRADTARGMGYAGPDGGLLDPAVNLTYGVKYLRGAWLLSRGSEDTAISWYSRGYYYEAKRRGMLARVGLR